MQIRENNNLTTSKDISLSLNLSKSQITDDILLGEVLDIISNDKHPEYDKDKNNIHFVKVRFIKDLGRNNELLIWASPLSCFIKQLPVLHETVIVFNLNGKYFYQVVSFENNTNNNSIFNLTESRLKTNENNLSKYTNNNSFNKDDNISENTLGKTFKDLNNNVKHFNLNEGDCIIQGRFGNSIKIGNTDNEPNIKLLIGQNDNNTLYNDDINADITQLWMLYNETVNIKPITYNKNYHLSSSKVKQGEYNGQQVIINSDRIILNSRNNDIQLFSNLGVSVCSNGFYSVDTYDDIILNSISNIDIKCKEKIDIKNEKGTFFDSPKIILGKNASQPLVLGNELVNILGSILDAIVKQTHTTGTGPSGPPVNSSEFLGIKRKLKQILSTQNKTL